MAIDAIVLAAGRSRRYGQTNKLLAHINGRPMLEHVLAAATASRVRRVTVVTGYQRRRIERLVQSFCRRHCSPRPRLRHNPGYRSGLSSSLHIGLAALPSDCDGAVICLGDMPGITATLINSLLQARTLKALAVRPVHAGRPGNPVLLLRPLFPEVLAVHGDCGAGAILKRLPAEQLQTINTGPAVRRDVDRRRDQWRRGRPR